MIKAPQKASLWWLFTSDGTRRKMWQHFAAGAFFYPHHFVDVSKMVGIVFFIVCPPRRNYNTWYR